MFAGRHLRYGSVRFPVEATRVFVIRLLLSLQLGVLSTLSLELAKGNCLVSMVKFRLELIF